ncbi:hypothetical protein F4825DRAFT_382223 [Nemania diffusa]|nr:hypothetical protein F4825DRAFT_382223 [Nemania diffusa]
MRRARQLQVFSCNLCVTAHEPPSVSHLRRSPIHTYMETRGHRYVPTYLHITYYIIHATLTRPWQGIVLYPLLHTRDSLHLVWLLPNDQRDQREHPLFSHSSLGRLLRSSSNLDFAPSEALHHPRVLLLCVVLLIFFFVLYHSPTPSHQHIHTYIHTHSHAHTHTHIRTHIGT